MFGKLAKGAHKRRRQVVAAFAVVAVAAALYSSGISDDLEAFSLAVPGSDSQVANDLISSATGTDPAGSVVALVDLDGTINGGRAHRQVKRITRELENDPGVVSTTDFFETHDQTMVAQDRYSTYVVAQLDRQAQVEVEATVRRLMEQFAARPAVRLGGSAVAYVQAPEAIRGDLARAELVALPLVFLLAFWFFRGAVAAALLVVVAAVASVVSFAALQLATVFTDVSAFALNMVIAFSLGLAADYTLLLVSRFREERAQADDVLALQTTMRTAGRTVLFSSLTIGIALSGLLVFSSDYLFSVGLGGVIAVVMCSIVTLALVPALLALLGSRINSLSPSALQRRAAREAQPLESGAWYRLARAVSARPLPLAVAVTAVLVVAAIPVTGMKFTVGSPDSLPEQWSARQVDSALERNFARHPATSTTLVSSRPERPELRALKGELESVSGVSAVAGPTWLDSTTAALEVFSAHEPLEADGQALVSDLRAVSNNSGFHLTGLGASYADYRAAIEEDLPLALAILVVGTFGVLFVMTGSVVLPIKTLVMNLLSTAAALGLVVVLVQDGGLAGLLGFSERGVVDLHLPVVLGAISFGLATDYGVILLSRIKEARDAGASDREAVAIGLERVGRVFTAAALLFCVAFGAIATSELVQVKEVGLGSVMAILIDATLVRALLVPALMLVLGRWNWWRPRAPFRHRKRPRANDA